MNNTGTFSLHQTMGPAFAFCCEKRCRRFRCPARTFATQKCYAGSVVRPAHLLRKSATPVPLSGPHICYAKMLRRFRCPARTFATQKCYAGSVVRPAHLLRKSATPVPHKSPQLALRAFVLWNKWLFCMCPVSGRKGQQIALTRHESYLGATSSCWRMW
jgi:hypothetical protein